MQTIVLVSCVKLKQTRPAAARELYVSDWFRKAYRYAERLRPDRIFILSAKHHLLDPERVIEPYNETLREMSQGKRKEWAKIVLEQLHQVAEVNSDQFIFLAGDKYRQFLTPHIRHYESPMKGLGIGRLLHFLGEALK